MVVVGCGNGTVGFEFLFYHIIGFFLKLFIVL